MALRPRTLDWQLDPRRPELLEDVLDWFEEAAEADPLETSVLADNGPAIDVLRRRGFEERTDGPWTAFMLRDLEQIPEPALSAPYALRTVSGEGDLERRVEVHRAAWEPSRFTLESYLEVRRTWPYREDLDCVAQGRDGSFSSYALAWYDDENHVGELEPVGTMPAQRRRGLARATSLFALRRLRAVGAEAASVLCRGDAGYPIPKCLYESVGFRQHSRSIAFTKLRASPH